MLQGGSTIMTKQMSHYRYKYERQKGQALTEMAVMIPVFVLLILFSFYFWEIIQTKLKLQEMTRYTAWEFTAYPLHDYQRDRQSDSMFSQVQDQIETEAMNRYDDLDSSTTHSTPTHKHSFMVTGWEIQRIKTRNNTPPNVNGDMWVELGFNIILSLESWIESLIRKGQFPNQYTSAMELYAIRNASSMPHRWGFNTNSYAEVTITASVYNQYLPSHYMESGEAGWFSNVFLKYNKLRLQDHAELIVDSWRLNDGADVKHGETENGFYRQVKRIYLINDNASIPATTLMKLARTLTSAAGWEPNLPDAQTPVVVSINHQHEGQSITSGRIMLQVDRGRSEFDTAPLSIKGTTTTPYYDTLIERGDYFMGCSEPMNLSCGAGLASQSPFGENIHWPPDGD